MILPQLRLGKNKDWAPFPVLQKHYESQDKETLKSICQQKKSSDWRTDYQPCQDLNDWIEVPWSTFFDLDLVRDQHNVRVHERKVGHGWGMDDPTTFHLGLSRDDVIVVDPTSFPSNGSDWEMIEQLQQQQQKSNNKAGFKDRFFSTQDGLSQEERDSMTLRLPLKNMVNTTQLLQMDQKYIQFGSLVYGLRFLTSGSKQLVALQKAMRKDVFVVPNQFQPVTQVAKTITKTLGGVEVYSAIHMTMDALARIELENQKMLKKENAEIQGKRFVDTTKVAHADGTPYSVQELLDQLSPKIQTELMSALVRELKGDMPINQAISASLPLEDSSLRDLLSSPSSLETSRRSLLTACIDYRKTEDKTFPIYYLSNDVYDDIIAHRELFGPMIDAFPCTFTKNDIYEWGVVNSNWAKNIYSLTDQDVDYEKLLSPVVEMLVARDGKEELIHF